MYKPTWSYNKIRINRFSDTWNVWVPFPSNSIDETFLNFVHSKGSLRQSRYRDYKKADKGGYIFTSYNIYLDEDVKNIERRFDTLLTLVGDVGGVFKGLTIICSIFLYQWQTYNHDLKLA